jgi:hypothetical protein
LPIKLCLQHSRASLSCISKLFQVPPKNQLQIILNHMLRFSHSNNSCSLVLIFCVSQTFVAMTKYLTKQLNGRKDLFCSWFRSFSPSLKGGYTSHCGGQKQRESVCLYWRFFPFSIYSINHHLFFPLFIYSYVHTWFGPFLPHTPCLFPLPHPSCYQAEPVLIFSPILLKIRHKQ